MRSPRLPTFGRGFNRAAVQEALTHALNLWKCIAPKEYPNGAVAFCSEELSEIFHPPMPLKGRFYNCGGQFDTSVIQNAINIQLGPTYGVLVIDGSDAAFGKVRGLGVPMASGPVISDLGHLGSHIAGRTRRGGQSALRYSRLREGSELAYLRKIAERADVLFSDVEGMIIAGKADMKHKLVAEMSAPLQKRVICIVDLACNSGSEALRQAVLRAADSAASAENRGVEQHLSQFFELLETKESLCCFGEVETVQALEMGAVEKLFLATDLQTRFTHGEWKSLAEAQGTNVIEIHPRTELASRFCQSFGVGGCLRWPVDLDFDERVESQVQQFSLDGVAAVCGNQSEIPTEGSSPSGDGHVDVCEVQSSSGECACESERTVCDHGIAVKTIPSSDVEDHRTQTLAWFASELNQAIDDPHAVEALTMCVEVVMSDHLTPREEVIDNVTSIITAEGAPEALAIELVRRW